MPDKKVATQASDGPWERETIITFNNAEKKAWLFNFFRGSD